MAFSERSRLDFAFCRISEEIYETNGAKRLFYTRGSGCLVKSKDLQRSLQAKSKLFLVTTVEVLDIQYVELQSKQNSKFKIIAEFLKMGSSRTSTELETYDLNESLFGSLSDVYVINGVTFIALTKLDKWYLGWKSIVRSRPLDFNIKNSVTNDSLSCYVILEAFGNHMKGFIPRQYALKYTGENFFLMRKGDSHQAEKYVHSMRWFDQNEVGQGAVILNKKEQFIGFVRYESHRVLPINVKEIFCKDTESQSLIEACEDDAYSDPNAREGDESLSCSQAINNTIGDKMEEESSKGSGESIQSEEALPRPLMAPLPEEQRGTGNNYGEQWGGSTNRLISTQNGRPNDGSDLVCSGSTDLEEANTPPGEHVNLSDIGSPSIRPTNKETKMTNSLNVGSSTNCQERFGKQIVTEQNLLEQEIQGERQPPQDYDLADEDDFSSLAIGSSASIDFSDSNSQNGASANRTLISSKGTSCAGSREQHPNSMVNTDEMEDDDLDEKIQLQLADPSNCNSESTVNPSSPNVSHNNSATDPKLLPKSTLDSGFGSLPVRNVTSSINNKPLAQRQTSNCPKHSSLPYDSPPRIAWGNRSMSYYSPHTNQASDNAGYTVEHLTDNLDCMDTLSRILDTEYELSLYLKYWKHLADAFGMPKELREKISRISKRSPSEDFFVYLFATKPNLTLRQFMNELRSKGRKDVLKILESCVAEKPEHDKLHIDEPFHKLREQTPEVLSKMALKLDHGANNYKDIAGALGISEEIVQEWGRNNSYNPTKNLLVQLKCKNPWTTVATLKYKLQDSNRPVAMQLLSKFSDDTTIEEVFNDFVTMDKFCKQFNSEISGTWNYKNLATAFKLQYDGFAQDPNSSVSSPTKEVFEWLKCAKPDESADCIIISIACIERIDALKALHKFFPDGYVVNVLRNRFGDQWIIDHYNRKSKWLDITY